MTETVLTCILCPMSCQLELEVDGDQVAEVKGNFCKLGPDYARKEFSCPTRVLTATARLEGGIIPRVPVRTRGEIPRSAIRECLAAINDLRVTAPVARGQVLIPNLCETGVDLVASRNLERI